MEAMGKQQFQRLGVTLQNPVALGLKGLSNYVEIELSASTPLSSIVCSGGVYKADFFHPFQMKMGYRVLKQLRTSQIPHQLSSVPGSVCLHSAERETTFFPIKQ